MTEELPDNNPKTAVGRLKPGIHAIPPSAIIALGLAMEEGERCYGLMNWRKDDVSASVYYKAIGRHLLSWWDGENNSRVETGIDLHGHPIQKGNIHHLAHVMACCAILIDAEICDTLNDDRPMPGPVAEMITTIWNARTAALATQIIQAEGEVPVAAPANADDPPAPFVPTAENPIDLNNV